MDYRCVVRSGRSGSGEGKNLLDRMVVGVVDDGG
jgi:hypothetical protein